MAYNLFGERPVTMVGYRSQESGQTEISAFHELTTGNTWETAYSVTTGKTFNVTTIIFNNRANATVTMKVGVDSSTKMEIIAKQDETIIVNFPVPIPFTSGTDIQYKSDDGGHEQSITLVGFEE